MSDTPAKDRLTHYELMVAQRAAQKAKEKATLAEQLERAPSEGESWSEFVARQTGYALCPNKERLDETRAITAAALAGIEPRDDLEAMLASLMVATYDGGIGCFQRATNEKAPSYQREYLTLGGKLARSYALLLDTLNRHRGPRNMGHLSVIGLTFRFRLNSSPWGLNNTDHGLPAGMDVYVLYHDPLLALPALRSEDKARDGVSVCPAMRRNGRCRLHGGKAGAPKGNKNNLKDGLHTAEAIAHRRKVGALLRAARKLINRD